MVIAVSILVKEQLINETVNYDTETNNMSKTHNTN